MAIKKKKHYEFRKNFSHSMNGSEVNFVKGTESPDYCLVYYSSNETDVGLGMVPEESPVLTDAKGRKLAFDRLDGLTTNDSDHFYVLDDKVVVVSGVSAEERDKPHPVLEMERDAKLFERVIKILAAEPYPAVLDKAYKSGKPYAFEDALMSMLSSHTFSFEQLKNAYNESVIAHRLEAIGKSVTNVCENAAAELGVSVPFQKFMDGFFGDFAGYIEEGSISHSELDFCLLQDVSKNFPEVYKKVKDFALVEKGKVYARIFDSLLSLADAGDKFHVNEFPLHGVEIVLNGETIPVKSVSNIGFDGFKDDKSSERIDADLNCADGNGSYTFIFTRNDAFSRGWDPETGNVAVLKVPETLLTNLKFIDNDFKLFEYREGIMGVFQRAYKLAKPTREVIRGEYAKDFAGEVTWSRALDFKVPEMPDFRGVRYVDFGDYTGMHALFKSGESKSLYDMSKFELRSMKEGLDRYLKNQKRGVIYKKSGKKRTGSPSM